MRVLLQRIEAARQRVAEWDAANPHIGKTQCETEADQMLRRAWLENLRTHLGIKGPVRLD
jgi:hypothetical protein